MCDRPALHHGTAPVLSDHHEWTVEPDATAPSKPNVLGQSATADYPICLDNTSNLKDGAIETKVKIAAGEWHTLRVEISGARFTVFFDGKKLYEAEDVTFADAGRVGLWTKDDSVTLFDDFTYATK